MATLVGVLNMSHGPFTNLPPEGWERIRLSRPPYRADVPLESDAEKLAKAARCQAAIEVLRAKLGEMRPDVLVVFGDDQFENFDFTLYPSLAVYVGESFVGTDQPGHASAENTWTIPGHPDLAVHILRSLLADGFDPAWMQGLPKGVEGMCHAIMRPLEFLECHSTPVVPILLNGYFAPQETGLRCVAVGRALRRAIDSFPASLRVVAVGSGGLWHTPGAEEAWLDEAFDRAVLAYLEKGDVQGAAEYFDQYTPPPDDASQTIGAEVAGMTGMPALGGPQKGTREIGNWLAAAAAADGEPEVVVDYVPIYSSPIGTAFAYWSA